MEWCLSGCGKYRVENLTAATFPGAINVIVESFFRYESVSVATEISKNPKAGEELLELCADAALDGVSLVAVSVDSGEVVSVAFNKLQVPPSGSTEKPFFEVFAEDRCSQAESKNLVNFMVDVDSRCNLFEKYNVNCSLEIMFLATLPKHENRGLAKLLCKASIDLAKQLKRGPVSKFSVQDLGSKYANMKPRSITSIPPQICQAIWTSCISQRVGKSVGFTVVLTVPYTEYQCNGKKYTERIGPKSPFCELAAIVVE